MESESVDTVVSQRSEARVYAQLFTGAGLFAFAAAMVLGDASLWALVVATIGVAVLIGGGLYLIDRPLRVRAFEDLPPPPANVAVEEVTETLRRVALPVGALAGVAPVLMAVVDPYEEAFLLSPGVVCSVVLWQWLDVRLLTRWEDAHGARIFREASGLGPRGGSLYVVDAANSSSKGGGDAGEPER